MKSIRVCVSVILSITVVLYMLCTPNIIKDGIERGRVSRWENKKESFSGIIDVWHIMRFKAHTGSVSSWISARASEIEKKHFGIFINVTAMTETEYASRVERGESADIYSFPLGLEYSDRFLPLDTVQLTDSLHYVKEDLLKSGMTDGVLYALPFMYSGYCIIENSELMQKSGQNEIQSVEQLNTILSNLKQGDYNPLCGDEIYACRYGIESELGDYDDFKRGSAHLAVTDFRSVGDLERKQSTGKGFTIKAYAADNYTDLVQYVAMDKNISQSKIKYGYEFIEGIISPEAQEKLSALNAYSVIICDDAEKKRDLYTSIAYDAFSIYVHPTVPNCFLYKRYEEALRDDAEEALIGDVSAKKRFTNRMNELIEY